MKKTITTLFCVLTFIFAVNAKIVYVASTGDNSDGSTWGKALNTIPNTSSTAIAAGDSVFVKTGNYTFSQSVAGSSCIATKADVNYLGGFAGNETNSSQRIKTDLDANGIVEPWELSNPSTLTFNATNNAYGLYIISNTAKRVFDGFKISGTLDIGQLSASMGGNTMIKINNFAVFQNNTISGCTLTAAPNTATANYGYTKGSLIFIGQPTTTTGGTNIVNSCLFENNSSTVTPTSTQSQDVQQSPFVHIDASNTSGRNVMSNCIFRKNQITLDYSGWAGTSYNNPRGMLISMSIYGSAATIGQYNCIKNLVVHNNSATFIPKTGAAATTNLGNGGLIYAYNTAQATYDSIVNCTVANNSMMRIGYAVKAGFSNTTQPYHVIANNVLYNNKNDNGSGSVSNQNISLNTALIAATNQILIANNIANGGFSNMTAIAGTIVNNLSDLASINTGTNAPSFSNPTTAVGYVNDGTPELSKWTLAIGSYLTGKGVVTVNKTDKAGVAFSLTTPAVGAYEYVADISTGVSTTKYQQLVTVSDNTIHSLVNGSIQVMNLNGQTIYMKTIKSGSTITLTPGVYIIRLISDKGTSVQKVIL
jgi:hypothetical protein